MKGELEEFRQRQSKAVAGDVVSATELARAKHWEELTTLAGQLVSLREEYNIGHSIVARAIFVGLSKAVREMKALLS